MKYLKYLVENDYKTPIYGTNPLRYSQLRLEDGFIDGSLLGHKFLDWVREIYGLVIASKLSTASFTSQIKRLGIERQSHKYITKELKKGPNISSFKIDKDTILNKFRDYFKDPHFELNQLDDKDEKEEKDVDQKEIVDDNKKDNILDKVVKKVTEKKDIEYDYEEDNEDDEGMEDEGDEETENENEEK